MANKSGPIAPEVRDRLKLLLELQSTVSAGQLVLLGLNQIKETLADDWARYRDRIYTQMEKVFHDTLLPREVFLRVDEDRYVVVFYDRDQAAAQILCEKIVSTVYEIFLGDPKSSGISIDSIVMALDPETIARTMGIDLSEKLESDIEAKGSSDPGPAKSGRMTSGRHSTATGNICYKPIWDVAHRLIYAYTPTHFTMSGRRRLSGYDALEDVKNKTLVSEYDNKRYRSMIESLASIKGAGSKVIGIVPVSFLTLSGVSSANDYYRLCAATDANVRNQIIFQVSHFLPEHHDGGHLKWCRS